MDDSNLGRCIYYFSEYFNTKTKKDEIVNFYQKYPKSGASELYRQQALELVDANIAFSSKYYEMIIEYVTTRCDKAICPWNVYRLNPDVNPQSYDLTIQVNTTNYLYNGTVKITVQVGDTTVNYIILHAANILYPFNPKVNLVSTNEDLSTNEPFRYPPLEFYVIPLSDSLKKNSQYEVTVSFNGSLLSGGSVGLYRGHYKRDNETVNIAATQFESTHARKAFPCFDEPTFRSEFNVKIIHDKSMNTTFSNMPIKETLRDKSELLHTTYEPSVNMVTYLLAILVSDFYCSSKEVPNLGPAQNLTFRTCSSIKYSSDTHKYSLEKSPEIVRHFQDTFNQKYQIKKLDQIALPQFSPGAMENWGLIKYRETALLWDKNENTALQKKSVISILAHEIAHQVFENNNFVISI